MPVRHREIQSEEEMITPPPAIFTNLPPAIILEKRPSLSHLHQSSGALFTAAVTQLNTHSLPAAVTSIDPFCDLKSVYYTDCSSMVAAEEIEGDQQVTHHKVVTHLEKKRKPTELVESECKNENYKFDDSMSKNGGQEKKKKQKQLRLAERKNKKKAPEKPPSTTGYDHVRSRRGEATNSHRLAERVRREKISERMSLLQSLVPGCDEINGKTRVLDEIINYVQSLQNQVEFLVMKLASVYPMLNDSDSNNPALENFCNLETPLPSGPESDSIQAKTAIDEAMASYSTSFFHQRNDVSIFLSQDDGDQLGYMDDQTQELANDCAFSNSCFF